MMRRYASRPAAASIALLTSLAYAVLTYRLLSAWSSSRSDVDSEWEGLPVSFNVDGLRFVFALVVAFTAFATGASFIGFHAILKNATGRIRLYRDFTVVDFTLSTLFSLSTVAALASDSLRASLCDSLASRPELMRDMTEAGLDLENCEAYLERAAFGLMGFMGVFLIIRAHFLAITLLYYSRLGLKSHPSHLHTAYFLDALPNHPVHGSTTSHSSSSERVLLLPGQRSAHNRSRSLHACVYAPVSLSEADARQLNATEAWIAPVAADEPEQIGTASARRPTEGPRQRSASQSHAHPQHARTGRIALPIHRDEGLFPVLKESV